MYLLEIQEFERQRQSSIGRAWDAVDQLLKQGVIGDVWDCMNLAEAPIVQPADVAEIIESVQASVIGGRPTFSAKAQTAAREEFAEVVRLTMRSDWETNPTIYTQSLLSSQDCIGKGTGVVITECVTDFDEAEVAKRRRDKQARRLLADPALAAAEEEAQNQLALYEDATPETGTYADTWQQNALIAKDQISTVHVPIESFFRDIYNPRPECWTFVGQTVIADYEAVMRDPMLWTPKGLKPDIVAAFAPMGEGGRTGSASTVGPLQTWIGGMKPPVTTTRPFLMLHKMWRLSHDKDGAPTWDYYILTKGAKKPLFYKAAAYYCGNPVSVLQWNEFGNLNFPMSDVMKAIPDIIQKREARSRMYEKMSRSAASTMIYDKIDVPTQADLRSVLRGIACNWLGVENIQHKPLREMFHEIKTMGVSQDDLAFLSILSDSIRTSTGMGLNQVGEAMKSSTSATEAHEVASRYDARLGPKAEAVRLWLSDIAKKRMQMTAQFYDENRIRSMAGPRAAAFWKRQEFTASNVRDLMISVEPGSLREENDDVVAEKLIRLLTLGQQFEIIGLTQNIDEMVAELYRRIGFPEGSKFLRPLPPGTLHQVMLTRMFAQGGGQKGSAPAQKSRPQGALPNGGTAA